MALFLFPKTGKKGATNEKCITDLQQRGVGKDQLSAGVHGETCIADNGMFPRYFTVKEERFAEIIQQEDLLKDKSVIAVIPA